MHVDFLRGVALVLVVLFHFRVPGFWGGFAGVDVFFVVSGFVMALWVRRRQGDPGKAAFPWRQYCRARLLRLLPALLLVVAVTLVVSWFWLLPIELKYTAKHAGAGLAFASNLFLFRETGYFTTAIWGKPLAHTWSLALEGQFYVLFPLLMIFLATRRKPLRVLAMLVLLAWVLALVLYRINSEAAYALLPGRCWAFLLGIWAVLMPPVVWRPALADVVSLLAFLGIAVSSLIFTPQTPWPGWGSLLLAFSAVAFLLAAPSAGRLRGLWQNAGMVSLGRISYSFYLWHWPLLVFWLMVANGTDAPWQRVLLLPLCGLLAWLSRRWVELPFTRGALRRAPFVVTALLLATGLGVLAGGAIWYQQGVLQRFSPTALHVLAQSEQVNPYRGGCPMGVRDGTTLPDARCFAGNPETLNWWLVWGDSHAEVAVPAIEQRALAQQAVVYQAIFGGCGPLVSPAGLWRMHLAGGCADFAAGVRQWAVQEPRVRQVWILARWPMYVEGSGYGRLDGLDWLTWSPRAPEFDPDRAEATMLRDLQQTLGLLTQAGKQVVIAGPVPEQPELVTACVLRGQLPWVAAGRCEASRNEVEHRQMRVSRVLRQVQREFPQVTVIWPAQWSCNTELCRGFDGPMPLYADDDHWTPDAFQHFLQAVIPTPP